MSDVIDLDHGAVLAVVNVYTPNMVKEVFEFVLLCRAIEKEFTE